jgi:cellulose synthase/poly-beta-1,6-N-acetylglucosamine synthase-like glycosyltransferase
MLVEVGFWTCLGLLIYIYAGYPVAAFILGMFVARDVRKAEISPRVTVLISAFNEADEIQRTVENKLTQEYPPGGLDIVVVSDGSTDGTDELVQAMVAQSGGRLRLLRQEPRQGKTQALNMAMRQASTDIVVFADANSMYAPDAVRSLVRNFSDPEVGYVTGQMIYTNPDASAVGEGSGKYMSYENTLRGLETRLGSIVGVDGGIDAIRRALYVPMHPDQLPDFVLPLNVVEQGRRVVYEPGAFLYEQALSNPVDEFRMRVRVSLRALWALHDKRNLLNPLRYPVFAWQLISHKVLRYAAFLPLVALLLFNVALLGRQPLYTWFLGLQLAAYGCAAAGHWLRSSLGKAPALLAPYYFVLLNTACMLAFWMFLRRRKIVIWTPRAGT